ncbi:MAG: alpha/beta hydrolase fold protein [Frankiales bacterium]|nr:alpha/beta hydrolase fold protein [Frankiales bacterium]
MTRSLRGRVGPMTDSTTARTVTTTDGRTLDVVVSGDADLPLVLYLHGTPEGHLPGPALTAAAAEVGVRLATFARAGYAGSTRRPGRTIADVVPDVLAVADELGDTRFAVVGASGGGPHALACGALAADRCVAVASVAGVGPFGAEDLDFLAGMGESNEVEFAAAVQGEDPLRALLEPWRLDMVGAGPQGTFDAMASVLSPPDQEVFTGEVAEHLHAGMALALRDGVDGWLDDDLAFTQPWGFAPEDVAVPAHLWQGEQDLMVPPAHGRWLADRLPRCTPHLLPDDGHLTLLLRRPAQVLQDLREALRG